MMTGKGFGLIEVLISAAIISMVVGSNAALYQSINKGLRRSIANILSADLLNEEAELARNLRDTSFVDSIPNNSFSSYLDVDSSGNAVSPSASYHIVALPSGQFSLVPGTETVVRDGISFIRSVQIVPTAGAGSGLATTGVDYRYVVVRVTNPGPPLSSREIRFLLSNWRP